MSGHMGQQAAVERQRLELEKSAVEQQSATAQLMAQLREEQQRREADQQLIAELRESGARVQLIRDGDVAPSIAAAQDFTGIDALMGVGGTPEGVISAAAIKCLGGALQGRLWPRSDDERAELEQAGYDVDAVLTHDDLVSGDDVFVAATGVTEGALLRGVRTSAAGIETESIVMRSRSGTVRRIAAYHPSEKIRQLRREGER